MAKTTTRPKPATTKKTASAEPITPDGAADIRLIPLDQLETSPLNVRKVPASANDDAELLSSIRETGIKQNLVVHALSETRFAVDAGGRRLKALKQLADDGVIPADYPVPCLVENESDAILTHNCSSRRSDRSMSLPRIDECDLVFPATRVRRKTEDGNTPPALPISGFSTAKRRLDRLSAVERWTLHDLRRSFATHCTERLGLSPVVVDKILNHQSGSVTGIAAVYQRGAYLEERKRAMEAWATFIAKNKKLDA